MVDLVRGALSALLCLGALVAGIIWLEKKYQRRKRRKK